MLVLGLDASTKSFGWAIFDTTSKKIANSGYFLLKEKELKDKLVTIFNRVRHLEEEYELDYAVIEDLYLKSVTTLETLSEARGVTRLALCNLELHKIPTATVKSVIGLTKALQDPTIKLQIQNLKADFKDSVYKAKMRDIKKQLVMDLVNKKFDLKLEVDDESDACAIAYAFAVKELNFK